MQISFAHTSFSTRSEKMAYALFFNGSNISIYQHSRDILRTRRDWTTKMCEIITSTWENIRTSIHIQEWRSHVARRYTATQCNAMQRSRDVMARPTYRSFCNVRFDAPRQENWRARAESVGGFDHRRGNVPALTHSGDEFSWPPPRKVPCMRALQSAATYLCVYAVRDGIVRWRHRADDLFDPRPKFNSACLCARCLLRRAFVLLSSRCVNLRCRARERERESR